MITRRSAAQPVAASRSKRKKRVPGSGAGVTVRAWRDVPSIWTVGFEQLSSRRESVSRTVPLTDFSTSVLGKLEPSLETNGCGETRVKRAVRQRGESKVRRVKISPPFQGGDRGVGGD